MSIWNAVINKLKYEIEKLYQDINRKSVNKYFINHKVYSIDETLDALVQTESSMCRYGDREFRTMCGKGINGKSDFALGNRLKEILHQNNNENLLVCIPNFTDDMVIRTESAKNYWETMIKQDGMNWIKLLNKKGNYYNAHVSRLYFDYQNLKQSKIWFNKISKLWDSKNLLFIEGEKTRLGVNNSLFSNAKSIKRIIAPPKNAFQKYDEILKSVVNNWNGELVLIALGPTATVLAYDLHIKGIRAIDIGNIDIEYEWFLNGATKKTALSGRVVEEVAVDLSADFVPSYYEEQVIERIVI